MLGVASWIVAVAELAETAEVAWVKPAAPTAVIWTK